MSDRLLESGTAQRLVASFAPPFDRSFGQSRPREVIGERFRLGLRSGREAIAQNLGDAAVQNLSPAYEEVFVGRVLNERVLETIIALGRRALGQHDVGFGEFFQRGLQRRILHSGHVAEKAIREAASDHRADLRHLARRAEPVEPRHQGLLQCRWDCLDAALCAALKKEPGDFLDKQRYAAGAAGDVVDDLLRQGMAGGKFRSVRRPGAPGPSGAAASPFRRRGRQAA